MSGTPMLYRRTRVEPRFRVYDDEGRYLPETELGIAALQPQPMTREQVADLVARARAAAEQEIARR